MFDIILRKKQKFHNIPLSVKLQVMELNKLVEKMIFSFYQLNKGEKGKISKLFYYFFDKPLESIGLSSLSDYLSAFVSHPENANYLAKLYVLNFIIFSKDTIPTALFRIYHKYLGCFFESLINLLYDVVNKEEYEKLMQELGNGS